MWTGRSYGPTEPANNLTQPPSWPLVSLVEVLLLPCSLHLMLCDPLGAQKNLTQPKVLPGSWRPRRNASVHMFMPSTPELLNSGMLAGVDTSLYLWGGSCYLFSGWCVHPRAFLNSGIRGSLEERPTFWQLTAIVLRRHAHGRSICPRMALN